MPACIFRYDGFERYVECDSMPTTNKIVAIQKPNDDRRQRNDMTLLSEDLIRYQVRGVTSEMHERFNGKFESLNVVVLERYQPEEKTDGSV